MEAYSVDVETKMQRLYGWLSEKDRRRYAAVEGARLGHGGMEYVARVLGCDPKTIRQGLKELEQPEDAAAFIPQEMAVRAEQIGVKKATMPVGMTFVLAFLAESRGGWQACPARSSAAAVPATTGWSTTSCGNCWRNSRRAIRCAWANFLGALATAALMFLSGQHHFGRGAVGLNVLTFIRAAVSSLARVSLMSNS
jgi:hypothetical protein